MRDGVGACAEGGPMYSLILPDACFLCVRTVHVRSASVPEGYTLGCQSRGSGQQSAQSTNERASQEQQIRMIPWFRRPCMHIATRRNGRSHGMLFSSLGPTTRPDLEAAGLDIRDEEETEEVVGNPEIQITFLHPIGLRNLNKQEGGLQ